MPEVVQKNICGRDEIGQREYAKFVQERINNDKVGIWSRMKKLQLTLWKSCRKTIKHKYAEQVVELKEDRSLFARMLIVARSRPEVNLREAIGQHEFTSLPRALFSSTGSLLPCNDKSKLMSVLEGLPKHNEDTDEAQVREAETSDDHQNSEKKVIIVDGMAVVQAMGKPAWVKTCADFAKHFIAVLSSKVQGYDEVHLVFERYDVATSLKEGTRERRLGAQTAVFYHVDDRTRIGKVSIKQFLSSTKTKDELTIYLAEKALQHFKKTTTQFIVTSRQDVMSNGVDVQHLYSSQEEADTRMVLHSLDAAKRGATHLYILSPDTDVLILLLRRYQQLCNKTYFVTGTGNKKRVVQLSPIFHALGEQISAALPGFHAFSGAD